MPIQNFYFPRDWRNPSDFPTHQNNEAQNRADLQENLTALANFINNVLIPYVRDGGGSGSGDGSGVDGDYLPLAGGTMRGILRLYRDPQLFNEATTKQYVDRVTGSVASDADGNLTALIRRADAIELLAQSNEGEIASLKVEANRISTSVTNLEGELSEISQTADAIETRVSDAEGNLSTITQTVNNITSTVENVSGDGSSISQWADAIESRITNIEGDISDIRQTAEDITMGVSTVTGDGDDVYSRITIKIGENDIYGFIKMEGNVDVSGDLSAEALYAGYGEIANLAVDRLMTSRRIVKFLSGDDSDDNFIRAYEQNLEFVTGECTGGTIQATNPDGAPLFWPVDVSGLSRGSDGYPVTATGDRVFTTLTPTAYPVYVYTYNDVVKRSISFEPINGIYSPIDRFGAGNDAGNNKAWILKTADGFDIRYLTPDNKEIGIRMTTDGKVHIDGFEYGAEEVREALGMTASETGGSLDLTKISPDGSASGLTVDADGYADLNGMRKVLTLDFSRIGYLGFTETLDGGIYNSYRVQRDASGRISKITDAVGHETVVSWGS